MADRKPKKRDADHYASINNAPFHLRRLRSKQPYVMEPDEGSQFQKDLDAEFGKGTILHFWGWDVMIAVVDALKEHYGNQEQADDDSEEQTSTD